MLAMPLTAAGHKINERYSIEVTYQIFMEGYPAFWLSCRCCPDGTLGHINTIIRAFCRLPASGKSIDTFVSFGSQLIKPDEIDDIRQVKVSTVINGRESDLKHLRTVTDEGALAERYPNWNNPKRPTSVQAPTYMRFGVKLEF